MTPYHVTVHREDGWYIGRVLERSGVTAQGRTLDERVAMLRDAIDAMWAEKGMQLELVLAPDRSPRAKRRSARTRKPRPIRAATVRERSGLER